MTYDDIISVLTRSFLKTRLISDSFSTVVLHGSVFSPVKKVLQESSTLPSALTKVNLDFLYFNLPTLIKKSLTRQIGRAPDIRFLAKTIVQYPFIWST